MILYHGSNLIVEKPRIIESNRFLDFGTGFYTTSNHTQAVSFAEKVYNRKKSGKSIVSIYEFPEEALKQIKVLSFDSANEAWLDFVSDNRNGIAQLEQFDVIYGPVADDNIYRTFILYSTGVLTKQQTLEALKIKDLYNQFVFCTEKALTLLTFKDYEITGDSDE